VEHENRHQPSRHDFWVGFTSDLGPIVFPSFARAQGAQPAPLASWNDGPAKQAIIDFVHATTNQTSSKFVPTEDRIATFDQDGTLWVEHPMYTQVVYCLDRVPAVVAQKPELKDREPFKTVLSGDREAMAKLSLRDLQEILLATLTGMPVDVFDAEARKWIETAKHQRWNRLYTELTYQPMLEVLQYGVPMGTGPTSSPAVVKTSCACIRSKFMESHRSRSLVQQPGRSSATTRMVSRFSPRTLNCS
jgi:hypothetical protein